jgi:hypothetical protein
MRIHVELGNSRAATSCRSEYQRERAIPLEMLAPGLLAWVKERDDNTSIRVNSVHTIALRRIAVPTTQCAIVVRVISAYRPRNDVLEMERIGTDSLRRHTVLAAPIGSLSDSFAQIQVVTFDVIFRPRFLRFSLEGTCSEVGRFNVL